MNLLAPISASTVATVAAICAALLVLAYILKMHRRRFEVPFSSLWQRVLKEKEATSLWRRLKRILSLLLLLTMLGLLLLAALEPELGGPREQGRTIVIIIDTSASMKAVDEGEARNTSRIAAAQEKADSLLASMSSSDTVMLMRMDGRSTPLSRFHRDMAKHRETLRSIAASDTPADLLASLSIAADALRFRHRPLIILIGDGAYPEEDLERIMWHRGSQRATATTASFPLSNKARKGRLAEVDLTGIEVRYVPVGHTGDNVGIVGFNVRRYIGNKLNYEVYIEIQNFSHDSIVRKLILYNGDSEIDVKTIHLKAGERRSQIYQDLGGGSDRVLRAKLEMMDDTASDALALDDQAWALIPESKRLKVLLVSLDNLYIEGALLIFDHLDVDKLSPIEYEEALAAGDLPEYDAVIYHAFAPETVLPPPTRLLYFAPDGPFSPFPIAGRLARGRITWVNPTHPVTRWLEMSDVNFDSITSFRVDSSHGEVSLFKSIRSSVAAAKREGKRKIAAFGFGLTGTDIMLRVAFPLLMVNTLDWFSGGSSDLTATYQTGHIARLSMDGNDDITDVEVTAPSGSLHKAPVAEGYATFYADEVGVHTMVAREGAQEVDRMQLAYNLSNEQESDIEPSDTLLLGGRPLLAPTIRAVVPRQALWIYLCLMVFLLLLVEWFTFNRRITI